MATMQVPLSPGVGVRRRGPKSLPKLPLSAFTPPNSGTSDRFPLPRSPSTIHPEHVIDAHVSLHNTSLDQWKTEAGEALSTRTSGIVVVLNDVSDSLLKSLSSTSPFLPIISVIVPLNLEQGPHSSLPPALSSLGIPTAVSTIFKRTDPQLTKGIQWALSQGLVVNLDVQCDLVNGEEGWEALEELISNCFDSDNVRNGGSIILSNILPPPRTLSIPIVKLLTHPAYRAYQSRMAALSLFPSTFVHFLPPDWNAITPPTPPPPGAVLSPAVTPGAFDISSSLQDSKEKREWKRRVKMYIGPVLESFGFERIIFGSSPASGSATASKVGDWYELARESFAELGIEQEGIDAVFGANAKCVYGGT